MPLHVASEAKIASPAADTCTKPKPMDLCFALLPLPFCLLSTRLAHPNLSTTKRHFPSGHFTPSRHHACFAPTRREGVVMVVGGRSCRNKCLAAPSPGWRVYSAFLPQLPARRSFPSLAFPHTLVASMMCGCANCDCHCHCDCHRDPPLKLLQPKSP